MSSVILTNWTVYYADDAGGDNTGYKQIRWNNDALPPTTNTNTVNELYSALADLFSIADQNNANDTIPIIAVTPTVYEIGSFDAGDLEPWFMDPESIKHLTGGSLETNNWTRVEGATANDGNSGIVKVAYTVSTTQFVNNDIGRTVNHNAGSTGTLLWFDTATNEAWIRPTNSTSTHNWTMGGTNVITVTGGTGSVTQSAAPETNERLWSNAYTIGTIADNTRLYVYQNFSQITNFWGDGHIDRLFLVNDGFSAGLIDSGLLTIFARQYNQLYDHFTADVSGGGANPVPLSTSSDINNTTGYSLANCSAGSGTFTEGEVIGNNATQSSATALGVITNVAGTGADPDLTVYYIGDLTPFTGSDTVFSYETSAQADVDTVSDTGPANPPFAVTINFGSDSQDVDGDSINEPYDVSINLGGNTVADFYEYTKYITKQGYTTDLDPNADQTVAGESYLAAGDIKINFDNETVANFSEGETVTATGGISGVITSLVDNGSDGTMVIRDTRGTFADNTHITGGTSNAEADVNGTPTNITPSKTAPFGTFAGGTFFGARGVYITGVHANDANNYQLIDSNGVSRTPPASVSIVVNGLVSGDRVSVFRANDADNSINKTYLASDASANITASTSWTVDASTPIPLDTPSSGTIRLRDNSAKSEERRAYTSWSGLVFTLSSAHSGGYYTGDTAYVPYIDEQATGASVSESVQYDADRSIVTRVRITGIVPYSITGTLDNTGYSATAIRNPDDITQ
jgi:hypothetical protein